MRQVRIWAAACALLAVWSGGAARADEPGFLSRLFGSEKPEPPPSPPPAREAPPAPPDPRLDAAAQLTVAQNEYFRRLAVITRLREHAADDEAMLERLFRLEQAATEIYHARTAHLPVGRTRPVAALDTRLGTGAAVSPLSSTASPAGSVPQGTASRDRGTFSGGDR